MKLNDILINFKQIKKRTELSKKPSLQGLTTEALSTGTTGLTESPEAKSIKQIPFDYIDEIYENLIQEERDMEILYGYINLQTDISEQMRAVLIDWIVEVHYKFKLTHETLFLCVHLIDKYLARNVISRNKLQLVGVSALLIACKYEEIFSPELRDFVYVTDKTYTKEDILNLEAEMLGQFSFDITVPSSLKFFEILGQNLGYTEKDTHLGFMLLELFLLDYRSLRYKPSLIACSVAFIITKLKKQNICTIFEFLQFDKTQLKDCTRDILFIHQHIDFTDLNTVKRKYSSEKYSCVSKTKII
jgi:hypothetical protein